MKPDTEMIEHENINKNSALAMFRQMESQNQQSKPPTYSSGMPAGQSYLKKPSAPVSHAPVVPAKSILKKPKEQSVPEIVHVEQEQPVHHVPDIIRQGDTYNDLDDCKGVSVKNIKNMWGNNQPSQPPPQPVSSEPVKKEEPPQPPRDSFAEFENFENEIEKESPKPTDPNDFDLLKNTPSVDFGDLKRMPEDGPATEEGPNVEELKPNYVENTQDRIKWSIGLSPCGQIVIQK